MLLFGTRAQYFCIIIQNIMVMNTDNTLSFISSMISSEASYKALVDMINEMDLEIMGVTAA